MNYLNYKKVERITEILERQLAITEEEAERRKELDGKFNEVVDQLLIGLKHIFPSIGGEFIPEPTEIPQDVAETVSSFEQFITPSVNSQEEETPKKRKAGRPKKK